MKAILNIKYVKRSFLITFVTSKTTFSNFIVKSFLYFFIQKIFYSEFYI